MLNKEKSLILKIRCFATFSNDGMLQYVGDHYYSLCCPELVPHMTGDPFPVPDVLMCRASVLHAPMESPMLAVEAPAVAKPGSAKVSLVNWNLMRQMLLLTGQIS